MKILKIKFKNIHSLQGENEINFSVSPLSDTGIFAIVGATGSGKSTILDIIMLAIYGQMPRINNISKKTIESFGAVITRNSKDAYAEVEYSVKGKNYRSKWSIRYNRNGTLNDYDMEVASLPDGKLLETYKSKVPKKNEEIIGLKYDQFMKSIILAQGSFSKFLKAKPEERTEMLEKITGSDIYRIIGKRAFELSRDAKQAYEAEERILRNLNILSDDEETKLNEKINSETEKIKNNQTIQETLTNKINNKNKLFELSRQIEKYNKKLSDIQQTISSYAPQIAKLKIHEKLVNLKVDLQVYKNNEVEIKDLDSKIHSFELQIDKFNKQKNVSEQELTKLEENLKNNQDEYEKNKPLIDEYNKITTQIEVNIKEKKILEKDFEQVSSDKELSEKNILKIKKEIINSEKRLKSTETWLSDNEILSDLSEDYIRIEQLLENYEAAKQKTEKIIKESVLSKDFVNKNWINYQLFSEELSNSINASIEQLQTNIDSSLTEEKLETEYNKILSDLPLIEKLKTLSSNQFQESKNIEQFRHQLQSSQLVLEQTESRQRNTENELEITKKLKDELQNRYEREQLEAKYEQDRLKLSVADECPLCGSTSHPYVEHNKKVLKDVTKQKIKKTSEDIKNFESKLKQINKLLSNQQSEIKSFQTRIETSENQIELTNKLFEDSRKKLSVKFNISEKKEIEDYYKNISDNKEVILQKKKNLQALKEHKHRYQIITNISQNIDTVLSHHEKAKQLIKRYKNYYKNSKSLDDIKQKLKAEYLNYKTQKEKIISLENSILSNKKIQSQNVNRHALLSEKFLKQQDNITNCKAELFQKQSNQRDISNRYFNKKTADRYEFFLQQKISQLIKNKSEQNIILTKITTQATELNKLRAATANELGQKIKSHQEAIIYLSKELLKIEINSIDEALKSLLEDTEVEEIKEKQQILKEEEISVNQSLKDSVSAYEEEKIKDTDPSGLKDLEQQLINLNAENQKFNQSIGDHRAVLRQNSQQKDKYNQTKLKLDKLRIIYEQREALNKLIGDSKGKKFAELAHQFTMSELITITNRHLKTFSTRYILDKSGKHDNILFVYDSYMGMYRRAVQTLSGGETFLVSLSMALALSDLASKQTKIESLFIDEGFGTLDEQTLDKALQNLEKLQADNNRTIGLISHIAEIKERMSTKIVIQKNNSGFSSITIQK